MSNQKFQLNFMGEAESYAMNWPSDYLFERKDGSDVPFALVTLDDGNALVKRWPELFQWPEGFGKSASQSLSNKGLQELAERFDSLVRFAEAVAQKLESQEAKIDALELKNESLEGKLETLEAKNLEQEKELAALKKASKKPAKKDGESEQSDPPAPPASEEK